MLDELEPGTLEYSIERGPRNLEEYPLKAPDGMALALWLGGHAKDRCDGAAVNLRVKAACRRATAYDPMNGVRQPLVVDTQGDSTVIRGVLVRDWPLIIRLADR
jgi:hypothetical protein